MNAAERSSFDAVFGVARGAPHRLPAAGLPRPGQRTVTVKDLVAHLLALDPELAVHLVPSNGPDARIDARRARRIVSLADGPAVPDASGSRPRVHLLGSATDEPLAATVGELVALLTELDVTLPVTATLDGMISGYHALLDIELCPALDADGRRAVVLLVEDSLRSN
jgi:hypothetical protein